MCYVHLISMAKTLGVLCLMACSIPKTVILLNMLGLAVEAKVFFQDADGRVENCKLAIDNSP